MAAPLTPENRAVVKQEFLLGFRNLGTIGAAAKQLGINRSAVYRWLESDPQFAEEFHDAREDVIDSVEQTLVQRARNGSELSIFFFLKRWRPEYRDRLSVDLEVVNAEIEERMRRLGIDPHKLFSSLLEAPKVEEDTNDES